MLKKKYIFTVKMCICKLQNTYKMYVYVVYISISIL